MEKSTVSTESYKGVRDFYPEDRFVQEFMFETFSRACESFGYESYSASILEPAELYKTKTSDEIVNEQTYTFTDRGDREVTLRPEMTPTVARMVAARSRELQFPLRLYSIPNVFRYERPQKGRLREHWQLNADIFGISGAHVDTELIALAHRLMSDFGASQDDFTILINDRSLIDTVLSDAGVTDEQKPAVMRILDQKAKMESATFLEKLSAVSDKEIAQSVVDGLENATSNPLLESIIAQLSAVGITNVSIDTSIIRGFDYYTGMVFEVFDVSSDNKRSLMGGGRYDNLMEIFGKDPIPTAGFALGDVTMRNFLETHDLLPKYTPATQLELCVLNPESTDFAVNLAHELRGQDINVAINYAQKSVGDFIKSAIKKNVPFVLCIGEKELSGGPLIVKNVSKHENKELAVKDIANYIFESDID